MRHQHHHPFRFSSSSISDSVHTVHFHVCNLINLVHALSSPPSWLSSGPFDGAPQNAIAHLQDPGYLGSGSGIAALESYHAGAIRMLMFMNSTQVIEPFNADYATISNGAAYPCVVRVKGGCCGYEASMGASNAASYFAA